METFLAEKLETIMTRAEANTRMRDFYIVDGMKVVHFRIGDVQVYDQPGKTL